ncbi:hypothetical protein ADICYQ_2298 [Cyclobacterium qasimii M12-11B]|uniref:Uncharacterized protein n=1 Tax=Cyclobacterium qasimii M12-11B TaxID=641524 RepID=S7VH99_9BACT|nr:hypothetical protein ADICYQ_2298 [Cyclobacterium qasimii M12-11B]
MLSTYNHYETKKYFSLFPAPSLFFAIQLSNLFSNNKNP